MATQATAQFWIRTDGADTNGGGYDSGIGGAATNYCDQAAAQDTFSLLTLAAGTLTSTGTGTFTVAMIGNAVNVPGQGYYWITARTSNSVVTVTPGTGATTSFTTQPGKVGGALRNPSALANGVGTVTAPGTASALAPGNQINLRASGSGSVGSPDYPQTGYGIWTNGNTTAGYIRWVAYNGTPYWVGNGLLFDGNPTAFNWFQGIYFAATGTSNASFGIIADLVNCVMVSCTVDMNNQTGVHGIGLTGSNVYYNTFIGVEIVGGGSSSGSGMKISGGSSYGQQLKNCKIHGCGGWGVSDTNSFGATTVDSCAIYGNVSGGVLFTATSALQQSMASGCTIDSNTGPGIQIASTLTASICVILNNNITTNGTYGVDVAAGSAAANTAAIAYEDYNNFGSGATLNTSGAYHNLTGGAHDINVDPQYNNAAGGEFSPPVTNTALVAAAPIGFA